jgi:hypothetical protein
MREEDQDSEKAAQSPWFRQNAIALEMKTKTSRQSRRPVNVNPPFAPK